MMSGVLRKATRARIYCDRGDLAGHTPLATAVVQLLWREHAAGVTVINAVEGFGASRVLHSARLVDVGANAPVVVEWLDTPERFDAIWPQLEPLVAHAVVTMESAVNRTESRGAHAREDFPDRDDKEWMKHTLAWADDAARRITIDYRPVHTYTMSNDVQYIEPKARVY